MEDALREAFLADANILYLGCGVLSYIIKICGVIILRPVCFIAFILKIFNIFYLILSNSLVHSD
jgi:hypothetical protein